MAHQRGAALWQLSCVGFIIVTVIACAIVSIGGRSVGLPVVVVWIVLVAVMILVMLGALRLASGESATEAAIDDAPSAPAAPDSRFDDWLVDAMDTHNVTTMQLAIALEVREDLVEEWLFKRQVPTPIECTRIARYFETSEREVLRAAGWG